MIYLYQAEITVHACLTVQGIPYTNVRILGSVHFTSVNSYRHFVVPALSPGHK